jgi:hypothetical protein
MPERVYFEERQWFRQPWVWLVVMVPVLLIVGEVVARLQRGAHVDAGLWVVAGAVGILLPGFLGVLHLRIRVTQRGVHIRFTPFHRRERVFAWDDIQRVEARRYRPLLEFGGWGIRIGRSATAYTVSGNEGVQLTIRDRRSILIGTRRSDEFITAAARAVDSRSEGEAGG